jgi:hypothetical protein
MPRPAPVITRLLCCGAALTACTVVVAAQEKKKDEDKTPSVTMCLPLAVTPGAPSTVKVRGLRLAEATEVRVANATATVKSRGKADVAQGADAASVGDTQVEVELTVQPRPRVLSLVVVTPAGETKPHELAVVEAAALVQEKEPNEGFRQGQELPLDKTVAGTIRSGEDVDVFRFVGRSGQTLSAEVTAARRGSQLDSLLTIYDAAGHTLATNDDAAPGPAGRVNRDSVLTFHCPSDGTYFLALTDANARGGATHPYLLMLSATK